LLYTLQYFFSHELFGEGEACTKEIRKACLERPASVKYSLVNDVGFLLQR